MNCCHFRQNSSAIPIPDSTYFIWNMTAILKDVYGCFAIVLTVRTVKLMNVDYPLDASYKSKCHSSLLSAMPFSPLNFASNMFWFEFFNELSHCCIFPLCLCLST